MTQRIGWWIATHPRAMATIHPLVHRIDDDRACWLCSAVWRGLASDPTLGPSLRQAEANLSARSGR